MAKKKNSRLYDANAPPSAQPGPRVAIYSYEDVLADPSVVIDRLEHAGVKVGPPQRPGRLHTAPSASAHLRLGASRALRLLGRWKLLTPFAGTAKVGGRRRPSHPAERGDKSARRLVTNLAGDVGDGLSSGERDRRRPKAQQRSPMAER